MTFSDLPMTLTYTVNVLYIKNNSFWLLYELAKITHSWLGDHDIFDSNKNDK